MNRQKFERLRKGVARVRPGIARTWMLHHENTQCNTAFSINEFLAEKMHSYSPNLSPCDFLLFPRLINHLKVRHFGTLDNIQTSVTDELKGLPSGTATSNGNNSVAVYLPKGTILKEITLICKKNKIHGLKKVILITFLPPLITQIII